GLRDAVLQRTRRVLALELGPQPNGRLGGQALDADERRVPDRLEDVVGLHALDYPSACRHARSGDDRSSTRPGGRRRPRSSRAPVSRSANPCAQRGEIVWGDEPGGRPRRHVCFVAAWTASGAPLTGWTVSRSSVISSLSITRRDASLSRCRTLTIRSSPRSSN